MKRTALFVITFITVGHVVPVVGLLVWAVSS